MVKVLETGVLCSSFDVVDGAVVGGGLGERSQVLKLAHLALLKAGSLVLLLESD